MMKLKHRMATCLLGICVSVAAVAADVPAVVGWSQKVELGTLVSGVVGEVHVRPGQIVSKGDELISLDGRSFSGQVNRRLAAYKYAKAALEEAEREDERAVELYDRTVLSDFERNQALIALHSARARAEAAHVDLIEARLELERSVVRAPFDGIVLAVNVSPGQTVVSEWQSQPLVTLADNRVYRAMHRSMPPLQGSWDRAARCVPPCVGRPCRLRSITSASSRSGSRGRGRYTNWLPGSSPRTGSCCASARLSYCIWIRNNGLSTVRGKWPGPGCLVPGIDASAGRAVGSVGTCAQPSGWPGRSGRLRQRGRRGCAGRLALAWTRTCVGHGCCRRGAQPAPDFRFQYRLNSP